MLTWDLQGQEAVSIWKWTVRYVDGVQEHKDCTTGWHQIPALSDYLSDTGEGSCSQTRFPTAGSPNYHVNETPQY